MRAAAVIALGSALQQRDILPDRGKGRLCALHGFFGPPGAGDREQPVPPGPEHDDNRQRGDRQRDDDFEQREPGRPAIGHRRC